VSAEPDRPRFVGRGTDYTHDPARKMPGEPEPLDPEQLAALTERAHAPAAHEHHTEVVGSIR
jgi:hypothetical protein